MIVFQSYFPFQITYFINQNFITGGCCLKLLVYFLISFFRICHIFLLFSQDDAFRSIDNLITNLLHLETAVRLAVGFDGQVLVGQEVVEEKDSLGSSHSETKEKSFQVSLN